MTRIQFKFGDCWQHEYMLGDQLKWGGNDNGMPNLTHVSVYGIAEDNICPNCNNGNHEEYDIYFEQDMIKSVAPLDDIRKYVDSADGNYRIL